jgi:hypothetical protein
VAQSAASAGKASTSGAKASRVASKEDADAAVAGSAAPRRKTAAAGNKPVGTKSSGSKSPASVVAARVQKKSTRRGIRLKTGGTDGDA